MSGASCTGGTRLIDFVKPTTLCLVPIALVTPVGGVINFDPTMSGVDCTGILILHPARSAELPFQLTLPAPAKACPTN